MKKETIDICGHGRQMQYLGALQKRGLPIATFLFSGSDGIGKKTIALRFIGGLVCASGSRASGFGCGSCESCVNTANGTHPDFIIWESDEEIGIAEIHELKRRLALTAFRGAWRGVLIDNAHRLLPDAQSALLKILEEPAPRTVFFLVTSRPQLLFETVRSRLAEIVFTNVSEAELRRWQAAEFPGTKTSDSLFLLAEGRPGTLRRFLENPDSCQEERAKIAAFEPLLAQSLADQFLFSEKLVSVGDSQVKDFLRFLIRKTRTKFLAEDTRRKELGQKLRTLLDYYFQFETSNVNPRLLVDSAILEARTI